jgi:hypothetical protein
MLRFSSFFIAACATALSAFADYETDFQTKATVIIDWVADVYQPPSGLSPYDGSDIFDPEKYTGPKIIARLTKYGPEDPGGDPLGTNPSNAVNANRWLEEGIIQSGGAPNLFHFRFLGNALALAKFPTAPGASAIYDSPSVDGSPVDRSFSDAYVEAAMTRSDNYNLFTSEGTENHINMARPSAWIYCKLAQSSAYYMARHSENSTSFPDPVAKEAEIRDYLKSWARQLYTTGSAEYDSSVYAVFNVAPWINLYEATAPAVYDDPELHTVSKAVLDWYAAAMALKYRYGIFNGASVRGEAVVDRYDRDDQSDYLTWLWFGDINDVPSELANTSVRVRSQPIQAVYAATSTYRPSPQIVALAKKAGMEGSLTRHGRSNYLMSQASETLEQFYIGPSYTLGSAQFPYGGWTSAVYRVNMWKLVADMGGYQPAVITGNNGLRTAGSGWNFRNAWLQVVQDENVLIQLNLVPSDAQTLYNNAMSLIRDVWVEDWYDDFTARWPDPDWGGFNGDRADSGDKTPVKAEDNGSVSSARTSYVYMDRPPTSTAVNGSVYFAQFNDTYIAIRSVDGNTPNYSSGGKYFSDFSNYGALGGLLVETASSSDSDYNSFSEFQTHYLANSSLSRDGMTVTYTAMDGRVIAATYESEGAYTEPEYDWAYGVTEPVSKMFLNSYDTGLNPPESWEIPASPPGVGSGRVASWTVDPDGSGPAQAESFGPATIWPVFDGPHIKLLNGILHLWDGSELYTVDYSGDTPISATGSIPIPRARLQIDGDDSVRIEWLTVAGLTYRLYRSYSLGPEADWLETDQLTGNGSVQQFNGGSSTGTDAAFYRLDISFE